MRNVSVIGLSIILFLLSLIWKPLIVFIVPGILILFFGKDKKSIEHTLTYMVMISLAFWVVSAWFIKLIDFSLTSFVYIITIISVILIIYSVLSRKSKKIIFCKSSLLVLFIFVIVILLRLIPYLTLLAAPSTGDMTMHAYLTRIIVENDGLPDSLEPILPVKTFGAYAAGMHTISAIISLVGDIPAYRSVFLVSVLTYALITFVLFLLLRNYFSKRTSLITALIATFLTTYPQLIFHWGGNPSSMSFLFVVAAFNFIKNPEESFSVLRILISGLLLAASMLTHMNPFVAFFYIFLFYSLFSLIKCKNRFLLIIRNLVLLSTVVLVLVSPFLMTLDVSLSEDETRSFVEGVYDHTVSLNTELNLLTYLLIGPIQAVGYTGFVLVFIGFVGFLILFFRKNNMCLKYVVFLVGLLTLLITSFHHILPFSFILFNDRISTFFIIPLSIFAAAFIDLFSKIRKVYLISALMVYMIVSLGYIISFDDLNFMNSPYNIDRTNIGIKDGLSLLAFQSLGGPAYLFIFGMSPESILTKADIEAMQWIERNTNKNDLFMNNNWDAGKLIPAIAFRTIIFPHASAIYGTEVTNYYNLEPFYTKETDISTISKTKFNIKPFQTDTSILKERNIKYIYIGKKSFGEQQFTPELFDSRQDEYEIVYDKEGVKIYRVIY